MLKPFPGLIGGSYQASSVMAAIEQTVNLYVEKIESPDAPFPACLLPTPGYTAFTTLPTLPVRGLYAGVEGHLYAVGNDTVYEVFADGTFKSLGIVAIGGMPTWAYNGLAGHQLMLCQGGNAYYFDLNTPGVSGMVLPNQATQIGFLDSRFVVVDAINNKLRASALLDGTTWPALGATSRSTQSDLWQALLVSHGLIWLPGTQTMDVFYDAGTDPNQPYAPDQSARIPQGIAATASLAELDNAPIWLSKSKDGVATLFRANGYSPMRISTHAFERQVQQYTRIDDAFAYTYQEEGHNFYVITFPTPGKTWAYDASTGMLAERGTWNPSHQRFDASRVLCHAYAFGKHFVGDSQSGTIYQASVAFATEMDGTGIRRLRRTARLSDAQAMLFLTKLQIDLDTGGGLAIGQGSNPQIMLRTSTDGGRTWGPERWVSAGKMGQYAVRALWTLLGSGRNWVFEISISDPVLSACKWVAAYLEADEGEH